MSPWEMPDDWDPDQVEGGGGGVAPGKYHFQVQDAVEDGGRNGELLLKCEVLAGTDATQIGHVHFEYITRPTPGCKKGVWSKVLQIAMALGLYTADELKKLKASGRAPVIHWDHAAGRQFCGKVSEEMYEGKPQRKLNFDIWAVDSPKAAGIPLNKGMLLRSGDAADDPFGGGDAPPADDGGLGNVDDIF